MTSADSKGSGSSMDSKSEMKTSQFVMEGLERFQHPDQFGNWLGYKLLKADREQRSVETELHIREDHLSPAKRVHGGVISAFFDYSFGAAVFTTLKARDFCSTVELKVNYFRPIELGDRLVAQAKVVFRGSRLCVLQGMLYRNEDEQPVGMATATFNVVTSKEA